MTVIKENSYLCNSRNNYTFSWTIALDDNDVSLIINGSEEPCLDIECDNFLPNLMSRIDREFCFNYEIGESDSLFEDKYSIIKSILNDISVTDEDILRPHVMMDIKSHLKNIKKFILTTL